MQAVAPSPKVVNRSRVTRSVRWIRTGLGIYAATRMVMAFNSGLPQPSDLLLAAMLLFAWRPAHARWVLTAYPTYVLFVAWVGLVSVSWALVRSDLQYLLHTAFQAFNFGLFSMVAVNRLQDHKRLDRWVRRGITFATWAEFAVVVGGGEVFRAEGTFNNPNQLGYWAMCAAGLYLVAQPRRSWRDLYVLAPLVWIEMATTSRAGVVAMGVIVLAWMWDLLKKSPNRTLYVGGALCALLIASGGTFSLESDQLASLENRFLKEDALGETSFRNLDRISNYPEYAILGAGEGDLARFPHSLSTIEIHSTPMTLLFSYGIAGWLLYYGFYLKLFRRSAWTTRGILIALFLYSTTHQGLRFSMSWFLMGFIATDPILAARALRRRRQERLEALAAQRSAR